MSAVASRGVQPGLALAELEAVHHASLALVRRTPQLSSAFVSRRTGGTVVFKAENLQRTGSFKLRGALAKLRRLGEGCRGGVVAGSAGNHAQSLAHAARAQRLPCEVFMPANAPVAKVAAAEDHGALVRLGGESVDECVRMARQRAEDAGMAFVSPFDDVDIVAGQAGVGLELLEDTPDLAKVVVPLGGGGLASGIALAVRQQRPEVEVVGVQVESCAPYAASLREGRAVEVATAPTIADGIAVKRPGEVTLPLVERWLEDVVVVNDDDVAEAMVLLLERSKLVVEGAGAVGVAALLHGLVRPAATGTTAVILSGGNVDAGLLAAIARRHETEAGRRLRLFTRVPDTAGSLARLLACVGAAGANLLDVGHVRDATALHVRETGVELTMETRGEAHSEAVREALGRAGYAVEYLG